MLIPESNIHVIDEKMRSRSLVLVCFAALIAVSCGSSHEPDPDFSTIDFNDCAGLEGRQVIGVAESCGLIRSVRFFIQLGAQHCGLLVHLEPSDLVFLDMIARIPTGGKKYHSIIRCRVVQRNFVEHHRDRRDPFDLGVGEFRYTYHTTHDFVMGAQRTLGDVWGVAEEYLQHHQYYGVVLDNCQSFSLHMLKKIGNVRAVGHAQSVGTLICNRFRTPVSCICFFVVCYFCCYCCLGVLFTKLQTISYDDYFFVIIIIIIIVIPILI